MMLNQFTFISERKVYSLPIVNPGFETSSGPYDIPVGWVANTNDGSLRVYAVSSTKNSGKYSCSMLQGYWIQQQNIPVIGGLEYTLSFYAISHRESSDGFRVDVDNSSGAWIAGALFPNDAEWKEYSFTFTPSAEETSISIKFSAFSRGYIDDISCSAKV